MGTVSDWAIAILPALAALAGVWVTQLHQRVQARDARAEARRDAQRRVLTELVLAGSDKFSSYEVLLPLLSRLTKDDNFAHSEFVNRVGETNRRYGRALVEAMLLIGDDSLRPLIVKLRVEDLQFNKSVVGKAMKEGNHPDFQQAVRSLYDMRDNLRKVEVEAHLLLKVETLLRATGWRAKLGNAAGRWRPSKRQGVDGSGTA